MSALHKPTKGRPTRLLHGAAPDAGYRAALNEAIATPRPGTVMVLDDRPLAGLTEPTARAPSVRSPLILVSASSSGALIAHAQTTGHPILVDPANQGRWIDSAVARGIEVVSQPATVR